MEQLFQDLRYSLRVLRQQPAFTFAAVAALALGIGATTAVFSVVNAVLLKPLPYPDADRIVIFENAFPQGFGLSASPANFIHWARLTDVVQDASAFRNVIVNYTGGDTPEQLRAGQVSQSFFRLFGARIALGRSFAADEDLPNGPKVAILSYGWWTHRFLSDSTILGKTIVLSGDPYRVIGVVANGFDSFDLFDDVPDVFTAFQIDPNTADQGHYFWGAGRLKPAVTLAQAKARFKQSADDYRQKYPDAIAKTASFTVDPLQSVIIRNTKTLLIVLLGAVAGVLLIACANVANLLLVRSTVRKREMAIRSAIGADRGRIIRQLMTESVMLSVIGGALGLILGLVGIRALLAVNTAGLPRVGDNAAGVALDWRLMTFAAVVSLGTGIVFGVMPALHAARLDLSGTLRDGAGASGGGRSNRVRSGLVTLEIALALMLVIGSGLLIRTSLALNSVAPGFDATNVLTMRMSFTGPRFATAASIDQAIRAGVVQLRGVPGVVSASASCCLPLEGGFGLPFVIVGRPLDNGPFHGSGAWITVSAGYFEVFRIPLIRGRTFTENDNAGGTPVAIINESMAKQFWKTGDPLTSQLTIGRGAVREFGAEPNRQIIGIVADSRDNGLSADPGPRMFTPQAQLPDLANVLTTKIMPLAWVIRTNTSPLSLSTKVQAALRQATGLPVADIRSMSQVVSKSTSRSQFNTLLMTVFALSALVLAAIGIYGVMAYSVQQRTREIGVRLALGASPGAVRRMVVLQGLRLAILGVVIGEVAALGLSRYMASLLFGVATRDPLVFAGLPIVLATIAVLAVWIPAVRASRIDPLGAIRST